MSFSFTVDDNSVNIDDFAVIDKIVIDDFESGSDAGWGFTSTGEDADADVVSPGLDGTNYAFRHRNFINCHLTGANAVDRGPQPGDVFEVWFRITDISGSPVINRFEFAANGINDDNMYRVEVEANTGAPEFQFEEVGGPHNETDAGVEFQQDQNYSIRIEWRAGNDLVTAQAFEEPGHTPFSNQLEFKEPSGLTDPGINLFTSDNCTCRWDEIRIIP